MVLETFENTMYLDTENIYPVTIEILFQCPFMCHPLYHINSKKKLLEKATDIILSNNVLGINYGRGIITRLIVPF